MVLLWILVILNPGPETAVLVDVSVVSLSPSHHLTTASCHILIALLFSAELQCRY
jgi:hypothetical protein